MSRWGEPPNRRVVVRVRERVQERPDRVDLPRRVAREQLEREQRRPAAGWALVLEPAAQELRLLAEAELADGAVRSRALPVVLRAHLQLQLVGPVAAKVRDLALLALLGQLVSQGGCLGQGHTEARDRSAGPMYWADGLNRRPVRFCSRICADQPATREQANIAGASGGGISATSSTIAE